MMKLNDARKSGVDYCMKNNCDYTYISVNNAGDFYLTDKENNHTVFLVNKNGSLDTYLETNYAVNFHKKYKKRENGRKEGGKRMIAEMCNYDDEAEG